MPDEVNFKTFPSSKTEALTMLYLQNQNCSKLSPEELVTLYNDTYAKIRKQMASKLKKQGVNY